mgnify:CR=1 FL=1
MPKHWRLTIEGNVMSDVLAILGVLAKSNAVSGKKMNLEVMDV